MNIEKYFEEYFQELEKIEKKMVKHYKELSKTVTDENLKAEFESLSRDEEKHSQDLEEMKNILRKEKASHTKKSTTR